VCEQRDVKGLYKKAREGKIKDFTGISSPYEEPVKPELVVETAEHNLEECAHQILEMLAQRGVIQSL
jgi:adenylylsulfate kinase